MMTIAWRVAKTGLAVLAAACLAACGGSAGDASAQGAGTAPARTQAAGAVASSLTPDDVCRLLGAADVRAVLGADASPAPSALPGQPGVSTSRCVWKVGENGNEMSLTVMQASDPTYAMLVTRMPFDGEPLSGLGDRAGVATQGTYSVEVGALVGARRLMLSVSGLDVVSRKEGAVAAVRTAAAKVK